jgi:hypothetical protein
MESYFSWVFVYCHQHSQPRSEHCVGTSIENMQCNAQYWNTALHSSLTMYLRVGHWYFKHKRLAGRLFIIPVTPIKTGNYEDFIFTTFF